MRPGTGSPRGTVPSSCRAPTEPPVVDQLVADRAPRTPATSTRPWALALAATGVLLVWTRLTGLSRSLWWDEAYTANRYVPGGAEVILDPDRYSANNHVLYSLLSSWTAGVFGPDEAVLRLWVVLPALASVALVAWWCWRRLDPALAVLTVALTTGSWLATRLHTEARGYGLVLLAASVLLVVPSRAERDRVSWGEDLAVAAAGAVGMLTFPPVVMLYLVHSGTWLLRRTVHRVRLVACTAAAGAVTFLVLRPLLSTMLAGADRVGSNHGDPVTWWSPVVAPLSLLGGQSLDPLLPGGEVVASVAAVVLGAIGLWWVARRLPEAAWHLVAALAGSVVLLGFLGFHVLDRYLAFLLPHVLVAVAAGVLALVDLAVRGRPPRLRVTVVAVLLVGILVPGVLAAQDETSLPRQNFADAAAGIEAVDPAVVVVRRLHVGYRWYLGRDAVTIVDDAAEADEAFCDGPRPAVYVPDPDREPSDGPTCLDEAERRSHPQSGATGEMVWYLLR
ncbi:hypothetical protein FTX61_17790 [Nitriliruptoraceae bacterium ZYF776]|nr:hypothetical protein [Profundirhabdus halotolerans]